MLETIATSFLFPKHFGKNYDALYDCLTDLVHKAGAQPGFVIVLEQLPVAQKFDKEGRETLLDVFREAAEFWAERKVAFRRALFVCLNKLKTLRTFRVSLDCSRLPPERQSPPLGGPLFWLLRGGVAAAADAASLSQCALARARVQSAAHHPPQPAASADSTPTLAVSVAVRAVRAPQPGSRIHRGGFFGGRKTAFRADQHGDGPFGGAAGKAEKGMLWRAATAGCAVRRRRERAQASR